MAANLAWSAVCSACTAVSCNHPTYGVAAAAIAADAGPIQGPAVSPATIDSYKAAAAYRSLAKPSQAVAAASIDPEPGPAYISAELTSGGNNAKSTASLRSM